MNNGFIRVAAVTPELKLGDIAHNTLQLINVIDKEKKQGTEILVLPELCLTGYTIGELFNTSLINEVEPALKQLAAAVPDNMLVFVGAPILNRSRLYNCAVAMQGGKILAAVAKAHLPNYGEFYEKRYFTAAPEKIENWDSMGVALGKNILFCSPLTTVACEICEDVWAPDAPSSLYARAGADIICNLSASNEIVGKADFRRELVKSQSARCAVGYVYCDAGEYESSADMIFAAHNIICESGVILCESEPFASETRTVADIDVERLAHDKQRYDFTPCNQDELTRVSVTFANFDRELNRVIEPHPFIPQGDAKPRFEMIFNILSHALCRRVKAVKAQSMVIGVSGGLDSSLALMVASRVSKMCGVKIIALAMPAFGTTQKTKNNAQLLCDSLGVKLDTVDISDLVASHLKSIKHDKTDVTYENAQARMRTLTLFDTANSCGGIVVGTGDLSEIALGFSTYNGDHMSNYNANSGVPKTLVKSLVLFEGERLGGSVLSAAQDILNTEISPELQPPKAGKISQKTEEIIGEFELNDFFLYYFVRFGFTPEKILFLAEHAFNGKYTTAKLKSAIAEFFRRFKANQFKRTCSPAGVKVGSVALSPRGDWRMPDDM